jgi:hypothetical protein
MLDRQKRERYMELFTEEKTVLVETVVPKKIINGMALMGTMSVLTL